MLLKLYVLIVFIKIITNVFLFAFTINLLWYWKKFYMIIIRDYLFINVSWIWFRML